MIGNGVVQIVCTTVCRWKVIAEPAPLNDLSEQPRRPLAVLRIKTIVLTHEVVQTGEGINKPNVGVGSQPRQMQAHQGDGLPVCLSVQGRRSGWVGDALCDRKLEQVLTQGIHSTRVSERLG